MRFDDSCKVFNFICFLLIFSSINYIDAAKPPKNAQRKKFSSSEKVSFHKRLVADLLDHKDYNRNVRPVRNSKECIDIYIHQKLVQILEVNERGQYVALNLWTTISWYDEFLAWKPEHYQNITQIVVPYDEVWLPDAIVDNSLKMNPKHSERHSFLKLKMEVNVTTTKALVTYTYPSIYNFSCLMDVSRFPFDTQSCSLYFSSWSYSAAEMRFVSVPDDPKDRLLNETEEWNIISFDAIVLEVPSALGTVSMLDLKLVMRRKSIYYIVNMVIPTVLITFVSLLGFFSPSSSSAKRKEKMMLGINTLLAMSVLQLAISDTMPITSNNIPLIGGFFVAVMILTSLATGTTVGVINTEKNGYYGHKLSEKVKQIVRSRTGRCLGSKAPPPDARKKSINDYVQEMNLNKLRWSRQNSEKLSPKAATVEEECILKAFDLLSNEINKLHEYFNKKAEDDSSCLEWQWFSNMIDRLLFIFFVLLLSGLALLFFSFGQE